MDRVRIRDEVIEILCAKLPNLPLPVEDLDFDYDSQSLVPEITDNDLDIAEVGMDLEDAFGFNFEGQTPGDGDLATIGEIVDLIHGHLAKRYA